MPILILFRYSLGCAISINWGFVKIVTSNSRLSYSSGITCGNLGSSDAAAIATLIVAWIALSIGSGYPIHPLNWLFLFKVTKTPNFSLSSSGQSSGTRICSPVSR